MLWPEASDCSKAQRLRCAPVPVTTPPDDRSPVATAYHWASRIMVVAMTMVLPGLAGHWLDEQLGTVVLFLLIGLGLGCTAAVFQLIQIATKQSRSKDN
jgi:F0F1-type ATP synthase assembly protein I